MTAHRGTDVVSSEDREHARENERLRRETCAFKEERDMAIPFRRFPTDASSTVIAVASTLRTATR